jgi:hypothetical protein
LKSQLGGALLTLGDLRGQWKSFREKGAWYLGACGIRKGAAGHRPVAQSSAAWEVSPRGGPILGERIEMYRPGEAEQVLQLTETEPLPCEWTHSGVRWRAQLIPSNIGDASRLFEIESLTGPKGYTYEAVVRGRDTLVLFTLSTPEFAVPFLRRLVNLGWEKAASQLSLGVV